MAIEQPVHGNFLSALTSPSVGLGGWADEGLWSRSGNSHVMRSCQRLHRAPGKNRSSDLGSHQEAARTAQQDRHDRVRGRGRRAPATRLGFDHGWLRLNPTFLNLRAPALLFDHRLLTEASSARPRTIRQSPRLPLPDTPSSSRFIPAPGPVSGPFGGTCGRGIAEAQCSVGTVGASIPGVARDCRPADRATAAWARLGQGWHLQGLRAGRSKRDCSGCPRTMRCRIRTRGR